MLSGTVPSEFGRLLSLEELFIGNNDFSGSLPSEMTKLSLLHTFHLQRNRFWGDADPVACHSDSMRSGADCLEEIECSCCEFCCSDVECCLYDDNGVETICNPR